jgi:Arc/MetJ-type ribon-helix-helix transcriptional regulator
MGCERAGVELLTRFGNKKMKKLTLRLPDMLARQVELLVERGWFRSPQDVVEEAVRRFLETHQPEVMEQFVLDDVKWGLHGKP